MWIRIAKVNVKQVNAQHLKNPKNAGQPMALTMYQQESRTAFFVSKNKKVFAEYVDTTSGKRITRQKWSPGMNEFAQEELAKIPPQKGRFKLTVVGWVFFLLAFGLLGYLAYDGLQEPGKVKGYTQKMDEKAKVAMGDIYFGTYRIYKEKGSVLGSKGGFGWFKVVSIEDDIYHIAKSVEMSKTAKPKEALNSSDFEKGTSAVKAKGLQAYNKQFVSEDGLTEFNFNEKKE